MRFDRFVDGSVATFFVAVLISLVLVLCGAWLFVASTPTKIFTAAIIIIPTIGGIVNVLWFRNK